MSSEWGWKKKTAKLNQKIADGIRQHNKDNPNLNQTAIRDWVEETYGVSVGVSTVNNVINNVTWTKY